MPIRIGAVVTQELVFNYSQIAVHGITVCVDFLFPSLLIFSMFLLLLLFLTTQIHLDIRLPAEYWVGKSTCLHSLVAFYHTMSSIYVTSKEGGDSQYYLVPCIETDDNQQLHKKVS